MQAFLLRRGVFAASILVLTALATTGRADDAGLADAGSPDAGDAATVADAGASAGDDAAPDSSVGEIADGAADAMNGDATVTPVFMLINSDAGPIPDDGSLPTYSGQDIFSLLCVQNPATQDPTATPFSFTSVAKPYPDAASCLMYADQGHPMVHNCFCNSCFDLMQQCDALEGCKEILKCELDSNCGDPSTCYFGACTTVIDKWNNTSTATFLTYLLKQCGTANSCPVQ